jgi:D-alanine-D-alanine ligase
MKIGVIYNLHDRLRKGRAQDRLADCEALDTARAIRRTLERQGHSVLIVNVCENSLPALQIFDALFNLAESTLGSDLAEDAIAQTLEELAIPFTGSGPHTLRQCADKALTKSVLINAGIPTPNYQIFREPVGIWTDLTFPLIVKPVHEDGSIGVTEECVVHDEQHLEQMVLEIQRVYQQPALVEEFIDGREINAAVLANEDQARVLPLSEILFTLPAGRPRIVSFAAKWLEDSDAYWHTNNCCPAALDPATETVIQELAIRSCRVLGVRDYARVDIRLRDGQPYVLEVNPNPCINPDGTGFIVSAGAAGLSYDDVVNAIMDQALARLPVAPVLAPVAEF